MFNDQFDMPTVFDYQEPPTYKPDMTEDESRALVNYIYQTGGDAPAAPPAPPSSSPRWKQDPVTGEWYAESDQYPQASGYAPVANPYDNLPAYNPPQPSSSPTLGDRLVQAGDTVFNAPYAARDWYADKLGYQVGAPVKGAVNAAVWALKGYPGVSRVHLQEGFGNPPTQHQYYHDSFGSGDIAQYLSQFAAQPTMGRSSGMGEPSGLFGTGVLGTYYGGEMWNTARNTNWAEVARRLGLR